MGGHDMEVDEEEYNDDLYSDIFAVPAKKAKSQDSVPDDQYEQLLRENQELKERMKKLERENKNLRTNISSLQLTARGEIDKKNFTIKTLSERLKNLAVRKSKLSDEETKEIISRCQEALIESQNQITLEEIKSSIKRISANEAGLRKRIKFGNMSVYFFKEQFGFQREEPVTIHKTDKDQQNQNLAESQHIPSQNSAKLPDTNKDNDVSKETDKADLSSHTRCGDLEGDVTSTQPQESNNEPDHRTRRSHEKDVDKDLDRRSSAKGNVNIAVRRSSDSYRRNSGDRDHTPPSSNRRNSNSRKDDDRPRNFHRKEFETSNRKGERDRHRGTHRYDDRTRSSRHYVNYSDTRR